MFDEFFNPLTSIVSLVQAAATPRAVDPACSPSSTLIDQDEPSISISSTHEQEQSLIISQGIEEQIQTAHFDDLFHEILLEDLTSQPSSSNVQSTNTQFKLLGKWTKHHPLANVTGNPSRTVSTR
ncbi:hypothetical protein Tco_0961317 [Tanacetum coccineum]